MAGQTLELGPLSIRQYQRTGSTATVQVRPLCWKHIGTPAAVPTRSCFTSKGY